MKVLVVDDSLTIRAMIQQVLAKERDIEVIGLAEDAEEALAILAKQRPDVITLDIDMPGMSGLEFLEHLMEHHPYPIVMVSSQTNEGGEARTAALLLGAITCFDKSRIVSHAKEFVKAIRVAFAIKQAHPEVFYPKTLRHAGVNREEWEE